MVLLLFGRFDGSRDDRDDPAQEASDSFSRHRFVALLFPLRELLGILLRDFEELFPGDAVLGAQVTVGAVHLVRVEPAVQAAAVLGGQVGIEDDERGRLDRFGFVELGVGEVLHLTDGNHDQGRLDRATQTTVLHLLALVREIHCYNSLSGAFAPIYRPDLRVSGSPWQDRSLPSFYSYCLKRKQLCFHLSGAEPYQTRPRRSLCPAAAAAKNAIRHFSSPAIGLMPIWQAGLTYLVGFGVGWVSVAPSGGAPGRRQKPRLVASVALSPDNSGL